MSAQEEESGIAEQLRKHRRHIQPAEAQLWLERGSALGGFLKSMSSGRQDAAPTDRTRQKGPPGAKPA